MGFKERTEKDQEQQVVIYSNRPPKEIKGGAVKVIADMPVKVWVGPSDKPIPDDKWATMTDAEKHALEGPLSITYNGKTFKVYTFPVSKSMYDAQYTMIANGLIWPLFHSTDADALTHPSKLSHNFHRRNYNYEYVEQKLVPNMMSIEVQPNGLGEKGAGLKTLLDERRDNRKTMVLFAGDSITGTDAGAFRAIRMKQLGLKPGDQSVSLQIMREGIERVTPGKGYDDLLPDDVYKDPQQYAESLLRIAQRLKAFKDGQPDTPATGNDAIPPNHQLLEDRIVAFARSGGQVLLFNDWDGTQADITPVSDQARMQPAALKAAQILVQMEKEALEKGEPPIARYSLLTGRSRTTSHPSGKQNGALDLIGKSIDEQYSDPQEAAAAKELFSKYLTGSFYHGMTNECLKKTANGLEIVNSGFDPKDPKFKTEMDFVAKAREAVLAILNKPEYASFNPETGKYPLGIQENLGGIELNFRSIQLPIGDKPLHENRDKLKSEIRATLEAMEKDRTVNPEVAREGGQTLPAMRTHIESDAERRPEKRDPEKDYALYKQFNDLGNAAMERLKAQGEFSSKDLVWVHDYQCVNAKGDIYTNHIPFPPVDFIKKVKVNGQSLIESAYFRDFIQQMASHSVMTFQRPGDMKNFIALLSAMNPKFATLNKDALGRDFAIGDVAVIQMPADGPGKPARQMRIMNIPVGMVKHDALKAAIDSKLDRSTYDTSVLDSMNIPYDPATVKDGAVPLKAVLGNILNEHEDHRIFLAAHRNDYSKSTLEKITAAGNYMAKHQGEIGKTHFVFFLEPTRSNVPGYETYRKTVEDAAKGLRQTYGNSIMVIPSSIDWQDYMGLMRHPNTVALLGTALKDGHDLTLREAASVRSDFPPGDPRAALAILTTNGTGASDVLAGTPEKPGAFVIDSNNKSFIDIHKQLTEKFDEINELAKTPEGKKVLAERYQTAAAASDKYSPDHFKEEILKVATLQRGQARS